jgi:molybdopterin/thiamine biosynthesis adenylyltransferase
MLSGDIVSADGSSQPMQGIRVVGDELTLFFPGRNENASEPFLARQALAFGHALNSELSHLRFGVVGCGGTGSAVAMLLTRLGAGSLFLVDEDTVSLTNLNRLHGATRQDAEQGLPKVQVIARECLRLGLGTQVQAIQGWVSSAVAIDGLKACDVIFSCTDDHVGRALLSKFAYFYSTPVIDMGLAIELEPGSSGQLRVLEGRVSLLAPGGACLLCSKVISMEKARAEALRRSNPIEYERQKTEAYVIGEGNPNPAVVTFTTEVGTMAVNHLLHLMTGFRGNMPAPRQTTRRFNLEDDFHPGFTPTEHCRICGNQTYWGIGDMTPFLNGTW